MNYGDFFRENTNLRANELKSGDKVKNINPDCVHSGITGVVKSVKKIKGKGGICGNKVELKIKTDPKHSGKYAGKEVEKTEIQLSKITNKD